MLHGPDSEQCQKLIEAHKECLRAEGFKVTLLRITLVSLLSKCCNIPQPGLRKPSLYRSESSSEPLSM